MIEDKRKIVTQVLGSYHQKGDEHLYHCPYCGHHKKKMSTHPFSFVSPKCILDSNLPSWHKTISLSVLECHLLPKSCTMLCSPPQLMDFLPSILYGIQANGVQDAGLKHRNTPSQKGVFFEQLNQMQGWWLLIGIIDGFPLIYTQRIDISSQESCSFVPIEMTQPITE